MEKQLYNKIQFTISTLSDRFIYLRHNYHAFEGYYKSYEKSIFDVRPEELDVLTQLMDKPFISIFKDDYIEEDVIRPPFTDGICVVENDHFIGVHWEVSWALIYYLIHCLEDDITNFIEILNSEDFSNTFIGAIDNNGDEIAYSRLISDQIENYLRERVPSFDQILYLFIEFTSIIKISSSRIHVDLKSLNEYLKYIDRVYDFNELIIE